MSEEQPKNPLHGVTLKTIVEDLVERHGFEELGNLIPLRCFHYEPTLKSSLKMLRKTPWAREKVEELYVEDQRVIARNRKRNQRRADQRVYRAEQEAESLKVATAPIESCDSE
ncbi:MAG: DNA-binding protein VF530 [Rhodobacterales bacterium]|nr:DNA-binding protein VF530 [Rhodobacterales bacterium]